MRTSFSSSKRSHSTPKPRGKRASTPSRKHDLEPKPAWDDTTSDLNKYKLTPDEQAKRKQALVSKNKILIPDAKKSFVEEWTKRLGESADDDTKQNDSLPINYSAVLNMLHPLSQDPSSSSLPEPTLRPSTASAVLQQAGMSGLQSSEEAHGQMNQPPPSSDFTIRAVTGDGVFPIAFSSKTNEITTPAHQPTSAAQPAHAQRMSPGLSATFAVDQNTLVERDELAADVASISQSMLDAIAANDRRAAALELRMKEMELGDRTYKMLLDNVVDDVVELKNGMQHLKDESRKLRADLSDFTSHTSSLLTTLQSQIQQLFRMLEYSSILPGKASAQLPATFPAPSATAPVPISFTSASTAAVPASSTTAAIAAAPLSFTSAPAAATAANHFHGATIGGNTVHATELSPSVPAVRDIFSRPGQSIPTSPMSNTLAMSRSIFSDLPTRLDVPVTNIDYEGVVLPSYASFRRSGASTFTPSKSPDMAAPDPIFKSAGTAAAQRVATSPASTTDTPNPSNPMFNNFMPMSSLGPTTQLPARPLPSQFQPRTLGGSAGDSTRPHVTGAGLWAAGPSTATALLRDGQHADQPSIKADDFQVLRINGIGALRDKEQSLSLSSHVAAAQRIKAKSTFATQQ